MSGPRRNPPRARRLSRRDFIKRLGGGGLAAGSLSLLPAYGSSDPLGGRGPSQSGQVEFLHGVASGDPLKDRVILWTRVSGSNLASLSVGYEVFSDPELLMRVAAGSVLTSHERDYTVKVDADGLQPGTTYYYRFNVGDVFSPVGRTRTAPEGPTSHLRAAVVSCASLAHGYFNAYRRVAERTDLDVVLHLGDYIYEYGSGEYGSLREYEPAYEILVLDDYRTRHAQYKRDPDLQEAHRQHPFITVWDDHESANNSWRDGAQNHTEGEEGSWAQRKAWAVQAYHEWLPIRTPDAADPTRIYRSFRYGDLADFIMLDTRLIARDEQASLADYDSINDEERQLLWTEQLDFLAEHLAASGAQWKLLGQQVMFGQLLLPSLPEAAKLLNVTVEQIEAMLQSLPIVSSEKLTLNPDQWDGYRAERSRVFDLIESLQVDNAVVLTGDIHTSWSMDLARDPTNPLDYKPRNGNGSLAVEFVATSVTSPGLPAAQALVPLLLRSNPHIKYVDLAQKGYLLLDITPERVVGEHWYIDTIEQTSSVETLGNAMMVAAGAHHLVDAEETA